MIKIQPLDTPPMKMMRGYEQTEPMQRNGAVEPALLAVANQFVSAQWMGATLPDAMDDNGLEKDLCKSRARSVLFRQPPMPPRIGRFTLIKRLGAGGMGEVFVAYDEQLGRNVAIKLVRPEHSRNRNANQRLLREARSLARLSHPNVVQIYDVGTHDGRVFIAMELIRGLTLREWLDRKLGGASISGSRWRAILDRYLNAGRGLAAAHAQGLTHRDFKPENVLIGESGRVCVVDFGLAGSAYPTVDVGDDGTHARPTESGSVSTEPRSSIRGGQDSDNLQTLSEGHRLTAAGAIMGTPAYMSPQQMAGEPTDARTDQFSFCVALFEALYGEHPFGSDSERAVRQWRMADGDIVSPRERAVPTRVLRVLKRGLQADPAERYASMDELIETLSGTAAPRGRNWFGGAAAVMLLAAFFVLGRGAEQPAPCSTVGASLAQTWNDSVAARLRQVFLATGAPYASETFARVQFGLNDYSQELGAAQLDICEATYVRREQPEKLFMVRSLCLEHRERYVHSLVDALGRADAQAVEKSVEAIAALPDIAACRQQGNLVLGVVPPAGNIADEVSAARSLISQSDVERWLADYPRAAELSTTALQRAKSLDYEPLLAEALYQHGLSALEQGDFSGSENKLFAALDLAESVRHDELAARIWSTLVVLQLRRGGDLALGHQWARRALAASTRILDDRRKAFVQTLIGRLYYRDNDFAKAEEYHRRALELARTSAMPEINIASQLHDLANALLRAHKVDEARALQERALKVLTTELGSNHPELGRLMHDRATLLQSLGKTDEARTLYERAIAHWSTYSGQVYRELGSTHLALATLERETGNLERAAEHAVHAQTVFEEMVQPDMSLLATSQSIRGDIALAREQAADAVTLYKQALESYRAAFGDGNLYTALTRTNLSRAFIGLKQYDQALVEADIAARSMSNANIAMPFIRALPHSRRGLALFGKGEYKIAIQELETAQTWLAEAHGHPDVRAEVAWTLARAVAASGGNPQRVRELARQAHDIYGDTGRLGQGVQLEIREWLASQKSAFNQDNND